MKWSENKLLEYQTKRKKFAKQSTAIPDDGLERELDAKIAKYCAEHGYYYFHDKISVMRILTIYHLKKLRKCF